MANKHATNTSNRTKDDTLRGIFFRNGSLMSLSHIARIWFRFCFSEKSFATMSASSSRIDGTPTGFSERVGSTGTKLGFSLPWTRLQINCKQDVMPSCSTNPLLSRSVCWRNSAILRNGASKKWKGAMMGGCQTNENWSLSRFVGRYPFQVIQFGCQTSKQLFNSEYTYEKFSFLLHSLMYNHNYNHYAITELFRCSDK